MENLEIVIQLQQLTKAGRRDYECQSRNRMIDLIQEVLDLRSKDEIVCEVKKAA